MLPRMRSPRTPLSEGGGGGEAEATAVVTPLTSLMGRAWDGSAQPHAKTRRTATASTTCRAIFLLPADLLFEVACAQERRREEQRESGGEHCAARMTSAPVENAALLRAPADGVAKKDEELERGLELACSRESASESALLVCARRVCAEEASVGLLLSPANRANRQRRARAGLRTPCRGRRGGERASAIDARAVGRATTRPLLASVALDRRLRPPSLRCGSARKQSDQACPPPCKHPVQRRPLSRDEGAGRLHSPPCTRRRQQHASSRPEQAHTRTGPHTGTHRTTGSSCRRHQCRDRSGSSDTSDTKWRRLHASLAPSTLAATPAAAR